MEKEPLLGKSPEELQIIVQSLDLPRFTTKQISEWLYKKACRSIDDMTNLSKKAREVLNERYVTGFQSPVKEQESTDGTKKYLFPTENGFVESAYIPDKERATLCVSSQVGCKMNCHFCMTGKQGFQSNLTAGEIVNQILSLPERENLTNIVYMGMGEPFDNLENVLKSIQILTSEWGLAMSPRRITVSTIGVIPAMKTFIEKSDSHLAVSMHSPFHEERRGLMPSENAFPIKKVIDTLRECDFGLQRRMSFEYIMFKGLNDSSFHVKEIAKLLKGIRCRVNLIRFHDISDVEFQSPDEKTMIDFRDALNEKGILATIRASRGQDISAACGLLSTKNLS